MSILNTIRLMTGGSLKDERRYPMSVYITGIINTPKGVYLEGMAGGYWKCHCPKGIAIEDCLNKHFHVTHMDEKFHLHIQHNETKPHP